MAASLGPAGGGRGGGRRRRAPAMSDINMTPFIDVMLVLLIVFMVAAPLLTVGVPVDLPQTRAETLPNPDKPVTVSIDRENRIFLMEREVAEAALVDEVRRLTESSPDKPVFIRGDRGVPYGKVLEVMGLLAAGGFPKLALISEQAAGAPAAPSPRR